MRYTSKETDFIAAYTLRVAADYALRGNDDLALDDEPEPPEELSPDEEQQLTDLYEEQRAAFRPAEETVVREWQQCGFDWKATGATHPEGWAWRQAMAIGAIDDEEFTVVSVARARELLAALRDDDTAGGRQG